MTLNARRLGERQLASGRESDEADGPSGRANHVASYIADMTSELAKLARSEKLELVAYLLEMANLEASSKLVQARRELPLT